MSFGAHQVALLTKGRTIKPPIAGADVLPGGAFDIGKDQVDRVLAKEDLKLGLAFVFFFYSRCGAPMAA
jgi:hypothetical protein